jgi:hypothetical protein
MRRLKFAGAAVYSSELLLNGIVIQKLELERYNLIYETHLSFMLMMLYLDVF